MDEHSIIIFTMVIIHLIIVGGQQLKSKLTIEEMVGKQGERIGRTYKKH